MTDGRTPSSELPPPFPIRVTRPVPPVPERESKPTVSLRPIRPEPAPPPAEPVARQPVPSEGPPSVRLRSLAPGRDPSLIPPAEQKGRILVVDDDPLTRRALGRTLAILGHDVSAAESGEDALSALGEESQDLVLLDVVMPGLNGYEVLERIKADPALANVPVVMVTAMNDLDSVVRCLELGADDYLLKPADNTLLRARVEASLHRKFARDREESYRERIESEGRRADRLLSAIFPEQVIEELKESQTIRPRIHHDVAVLFCDVVGFTEYCDSHTPEEVVAGLQTMVDALEQISAQHGLEKIKTIGDAFMATAGLLTDRHRPVLQCIDAAQAMVQRVPEVPPGWQVRVGIHVGPVMAGVVGHRQYLFDVWGDTVNTAARVQAAGDPGAVTLTAQAWERARDRCDATSMGIHALKGKGDVELFRLALSERVDL